MILAFASMKGGTGKSTLAAHSYGYLKREGISRWLVDMDPQASSFDWLKENDAESDCEHLTDLKQASEAIRERSHGSDVVIIDGAGALSDPTKAALLVADIVVVPCRPSRMDFRATQAVLEMAKEANRHRDRPVKVLVVPSMVRSNDSMSWQLQSELEGLGVPITPSVSYRVSFAKAAGDCDFVWDHNDNQATAEVEMLMEGIADYV
ncbi:ParA family protein [Verrucomicrobia bacterium]|jgi:chromosome partitioning protein|nr:ParA family protein [Verrucomicrobiota bacterium]